MLHVEQRRIDGIEDMRRILEAVSRGGANCHSGEFFGLLAYPPGTGQPRMAICIPILDVPIAMPPDGIGPLQPRERDR